MLIIEDKTINQEQMPIFSLLICIPHTGYLPAETVTSLLRLQNFNQKFANLKISFHFISNALIYDARESAVQYALEHNIHWILFIDSDMDIPEDTLQKLISHQKPVVSALAFRRVPNYEPCIYVNTSPEADFPHYLPADDWEKDSLISVDATGHGCILINTSIFKFLDAPFYFPVLSKDHSESLGEDLAFCYKLKQAGISIFVDTSVECGHIGKESFGSKHFENNKERLKQNDV